MVHDHGDVGSWETGCESLSPLVCGGIAFERGRTATEPICERYMTTMDDNTRDVEHGIDRTNEQPEPDLDLLGSIRRRTFLGGMASGAAMLAGVGNVSAAAADPREVEALDRGVVAVQTNEGVLVRWRLLGTDPNGIGFNLYRDGQQVNSSLITGSTNYVDPNGSTGSTYTVAPVIDGTEQTESDPADVWQDNYIDIPLNSPGDNYHPNDCSVGDLTGDGSYDIVVKWSGTTKDNAQDGYTDPHIFDAYTLEGEHLWRIDLGINVRAGAHYAPFLVYDFDGDGIAEFVVRTADGTTDDAGTVIGDPNADWRNDSGRILEGTEYMTVFDGATGEEIVTTDFRPARGDICRWGDCYGNRGDRFLAGVAYLNGQYPSIVMARGYYELTELAAFDFRDGGLSQRWFFSSGDSGNEGYGGQGAHSLSIADVDDDGFDEIIYGAAVIDHDGTGLHTTGFNHGDALHCSDFVPSRDGQEIFMPHEWGGMGATMRDAETGELLWNVDNDDDVARGVAANIDSMHPGAEAWASNGIGFREGGSGDWISDAPGSYNFVTWWTGDLQRELTDHDWQGDGIGYPKLDKWDSDAQQLNRVEDFPGTLSNNWTKGNPCLQADILGDWREEVIWRRDDDQALRLFVTPFETNHRLYTLMHDTQYRTAVAWQNVAYNQPPHPSFFVGENMDAPPTPNIVAVGDGNGGDGGDDDDNGGSTGPISTGTYQITNVNSGKALDVADSSTDDGANVQQYDYWGGENQQWYVEETSDGSYRIENVNSGKVMDVDAASTDDGANVLQWADNGGANQRWYFDSV